MILKELLKIHNLNVSQYRSFACYWQTFRLCIFNNSFRIILNSNNFSTKFIHNVICPIQKSGAAFQIVEIATLKTLVLLINYALDRQKSLYCNNRDVIVVAISDATGLGRTQQKPDLDYFLQTETRTRFFNINPNQTRRLISDENKYKNPTKNPNPAEPEAKMQTDPEPKPDYLNPSRSRTRLFETRCVTS